MKNEKINDFCTKYFYLFNTLNYHYNKFSKIKKFQIGMFRVWLRICEISPEIIGYRNPIRLANRRIPVSPC